MSAAKTKPVPLSAGRLALLIFVRWLTVVCLGLWLGGIVGIGAMTAPTAFNVIRESSTTESLSNEAQNALAGAIVGGTLRLFNSVCGGVSIVLLFSQILFLGAWPATPPQPRRVAAAGKPARDYSRILIGIELFLSILLIGSLAYLAFSLFPAMDAAQARHDMAQFDLYHHRYERISMLQLPALLTLLLSFVGNTVNLGRR
jgi:hypothetical protein